MGMTGPGATKWQNEMVTGGERNSKGFLTFVQLYILHYRYFTGGKFEMGFYSKISSGTWAYLDLFCTVFIK